MLGRRKEEQVSCLFSRSSVVEGGLVAASRELPLPILGPSLKLASVSESCHDMHSSDAVNSGPDPVAG